MHSLFEIYKGSLLLAGSVALAKQASYYRQWCQLCFLYSDLTNLIVAITIRSFPHSRLITGFIIRVTRWVPHVEQELLTLSEHLSTCCSIFSFLCNVLKIVLSFCPFSFGYCVVVCSPSIYHF